MKKYIKLIFSAILALTILMSLVAINVSAASMSANGGNYEVGQKLSISVVYEGDAPLVSVLVTASYDSKVLRFDSVSGIKADDVNAASGSIKFIDENFSGGSKKGSYRLNFTAIAAGSTDVSISATGSDGESEFPASKVAKVSVTTPKPSSNANLSSIKLSAGSLSPAFDQNVTEYSVTVKYSVESITITGAVADGKSTYSGGGTFDLVVGENQRELSVTAEDGTKKLYSVKIKRMTEEETAAADEEARNANPLLVTIDGVDYTIVNEIADTLIPSGFTKATATRKESEITVLKDANGMYELCYLVDANGENGAFYHRDQNDKFTKLVYINANNVMYIIEDFDIEGALPSAYKYTKFVIDGVEVDAITYSDESLADFYIFNCYVSGAQELSYYQYDKVEGTMQRAVNFGIALQTAGTSEPTDAEPLPGTGKFAWFNNMTKTGKMVFFLMVFIGVVIITAAILIISKIVSSSRELDQDYDANSNNDFILTDFSQDQDNDKN